MKKKNPIVGGPGYSILDLVKEGGAVIKIKKS